MTDSRQPLPLLVYAVAIAIRLTNASRGPTAYLVNHAGWALHFWTKLNLKEPGQPYAHAQLPFLGQPCHLLRQRVSGGDEPPLDWMTSG